MDEPALSFETKLSPQKELVRLFYKEMWDHTDKSLIPTIFHPGFTFRGSLGPSLVGYGEAFSPPIEEGSACSVMPPQFGDF